jgi:LuxR family maltose regulon positive regulatory protein
MEHTEGWPAGLYLAALSSRSNGGTVGGVGAFRGDDRFVSDYLRSELLSRLPRDELRFLRRTAVLDRLSGPLCDAELESTGSAAALESLERSNLFVVPLDRNRRWYRYHHLFQELLRSELTRTEQDLVPSLLSRAASWCEANGQPESAIGYAQAGGDVDRAASLFLGSALAVYHSGRVATVEKWLR